MLPNGVSAKCDCVAERKFKWSPSRSNPGGKRYLFQNITKTKVPELMTTVMSRYHDRPYNVNEL